MIHLSRRHLDDCHAAIELAQTGVVSITEPSVYHQAADYVLHISGYLDRDMIKFTAILLLLAAEEEIDCYV